MSRSAAVFASIALVLSGALLPLSAGPAAATATITYTYTVATKGTITADVGSFAAHAQGTYGDARGWGLGGSIKFVRVPSGGDFILWLSQASQVPSFGYACSSAYSCHIGNNVIINEDRWRHGSPYLNMALNDYRAMVVNHETGHWLGFAHSSCPGAGQLAYVMQQQSKGGTYLGSCVPNAWPRREEREALAQSRGVAILVPPSPAEGCLPTTTSFITAPSSTLSASGLAYEAVTPTRVLDTRTGLGAPAGCVGPGSTVDVQVAGIAGVPASDVDAVAVTLTAVGPTSAGYASIFPTGTAAPTSTLNFTAGQTVANAAVVRAGTGWRVTIKSSSGFTHYLLDVVGFVPRGSSFQTVTPARALDTRTGAAAIASGERLDVQLAGLGEVPTNAVAVAINLTAVTPTGAGHATLFPTGDVVPNASTLNFASGRTVPNFALAKLGSGGQVSIHNVGGATHYLIDVVGFVEAGSTVTASVPARLLDTRIGLGAPPARVATGQTLDVQIAGLGGVPATGADTVAVNVTTVAASAAGYSVVFPAGTSLPTTSNLNFGAGQTVAGFAFVKLGTGGQISIKHVGGSADYIIDVVGYVATS